MSLSSAIQTMEKYCKETLFQCSECESLFYSLSECQGHTCPGSNSQRQTLVVPDSGENTSKDTTETGRCNTDAISDGDLGVPDVDEAHGQSEKQGEQKWCHEAVLLLIDQKSELSNIFNSSTITQKQAWRRMSEEMCKKGYIFTGEECSRKFRSLKMRYKIIMERNSKTGNSRQSWQYFSEMENLLLGDPAVQPVAAASSLPITSAPTPTPSSPKKRKTNSSREPKWVGSFRAELRAMHEERMELEKAKLSLEERRVQALERLANASDQ